VLILGFEYGYSAGEEAMWCIRREGHSRMLCGRHVGFVPVAQPAHPQLVHDVCLAVMYGRDAPGMPKPRSPLPASVVCPACEGEVPVAGGRVGAHGIWRVGAEGEMYESEIPCMGVNLKVPERKRR
jgi:hypothetical protein